MSLRVVAVNLGGTVNTSAQAVAATQRNDDVDGKRGVIANTASAAAFEGPIGQIACAASKVGASS